MAITDFWIQVIPKGNLLFLVPTIVSNDVKWYIDNYLYATTPTLCVSSDSLPLNIKVVVTTQSKTYSQELTIEPFQYPMNAGDFIEVKTSTFGFKVVKFTDDEILVVTNVPDIRISNLSECQPTIERITDTVIRITNFDDNFGLMFGASQVWFNIKDRKEVIVVNHNIHEGLDLPVVSNLGWFFDPMLAPTMSDFGSSDVPTGQKFTVYTKVEELDTTISNPLDLQFPEIKQVDYKFDFVGYVIDNNGITVVSPEDTTIVDLSTGNSVYGRAARVYGHNCCVPIKVGDKIVLVPPDQSSDVMVKVSDKVSVSDVVYFQADDILYKFEPAKKVYFKPFVPGCMKIKYIETLSGKVSDLLITTNEPCTFLHRDRWNIETGTIVEKDKTFYFAFDKVLFDFEANSSVVKSGDSISPDIHVRSVEGDFRFEKSKLEFTQITEPSDPRKVDYKKVIELEMLKKLGRIFDYKLLFKFFVQLDSELPFKELPIVFHDCSYRVVIPEYKGDIKVAWFDRRLVVL